MVQTIYAVRDEKLGEFAGPFIEPNEAIMRRHFLDALGAQPNHEMAKHSDDFKVYLLGKMETSTGKIVLEAVPELVASLADILGNGGV